MITVLTAGLQTVVQDAGRDGCYSLGLPPSGALDQRSFRIGNLLVGNAESAASLEFVFVGPSLRFGESARIAVTGADIAVLLDGVPHATWASIDVRAGQVLTFGAMTRGARGYIAVRGGIDVPEKMGSRSTYLTSGLGGYEGRALRADDVLPVGSGLPTSPSEPSVLADQFRPRLPSHAELAVVVGLCNYRFTDESVETFFSSTFTVSHEANRTGYRLSGPPLAFVPREPPFGAGDDPSNVVNLGYPLGSIQIPSGTEPICLLRDAVTGGGYVTFGTIVSPDLDRLAQLKGPDTVTFRPVTFEEAVDIRRAARAELDEISRSLSVRTPEPTGTIEGAHS